MSPLARAFEAPVKLLPGCLDQGFFSSVPASRRPSGNRIHNAHKGIPMNRLCTSLILLFVGASATTVSAGRLYFTDPGFGDQISRIQLDGAGLDPVITFPAIVDPRALAIDRANGRAYFSSGGTLQRVDFDGSGLTTLGPSGGSVPTDIALDLVAESMYWSVDGTAGVKRSALDGSGAVTLVSQGILNALVGVDPLVRADEVSGIALDRVSGRIYWANDRHLNSMPLSGVATAADVLHHFELTGPGDLNKIKLDYEQGQVYWTNNSGSLVQRAGLDGSGQETLVSRGFGRPAGLAVDLSGGQLYFGDTLGTNGRGQILRADLDGGNLDVIYDSFSTLFAPLDLEFGPGAVLAGDTNDDQRVDLGDLNNVRNNFGRAGDGVAGDTNDDQLVDLTDLNNVRNNFGSASITPVPEPSTLALGLLALVGFMAIHRVVG